MHMRSKRSEDPSIKKKKKRKRQYQQISTTAISEFFQQFSFNFSAFFFIPCSPAEFCFGCSNAYKSLSFCVHKANSYCVQSQLNQKKTTQDKLSKQLRVQPNFISVQFFSEKQPYKCFAWIPLSLYLAMENGWLIGQHKEMLTGTYGWKVDCIVCPRVWVSAEIRSAIVLLIVLLLSVKSNTDSNVRD